jgi:hypothetical protein
VYVITDGNDADEPKGNKTMAKGSNLHKARKAKNNEFYTRLPDIEKELKHYKRHFKGKVVLLNCDDPEWSNFWFYFSRNFDFLGLKKLVSTHFDSDKPTYKLEITRGIDLNGDGEFNEKDMVKVPLKGNGDFRSQECIDLLKEADIVVTNPPFSLFREYIAQLVEHKKKFLVVGNKNAVTYKETFGLINENKMWLGVTSPSDFTQPEGHEKKSMAGLCKWFTNLSHRKRNEELPLYRKYNKKDYPKYDNYDAIEVSKTKNIPEDYDGVMGVPISWLDKYSPEQFEIVGTTDRGGDDVPEVDAIRLTEKKEDSPKIKGKKVYKRILIRRKK